jgi:site-specific DNA-methyltransferase (adenine-specific)
VTPYYSDSLVTIYHGDCRDVLPTIVDDIAIVSDPPFGTGWVRGGGRVGEFKATHERPEWDVFSVDWLKLSPAVRSWVVFAPPSRAADVAAALPNAARVDWRKTNPRPNGPDRDAIIVAPAWLPRAIEYEAYNGDTPLHPCQKPLGLMVWCCGFVSPALTVCDPFMGSGSTIAAARSLGRRAIGIEIEERYCEIAAERCRQEVLDFGGAA